MATTTLPPLGAHLSTAGGTWRAIDRAHDLDCTALQIFTQAPGRWLGREIDDAEAARFRSEMEARSLDGLTFAHAVYLINVAASREEIRDRGVAALAAQLTVARRLGLAGVVLHPGAHCGDGVDAGLERAADGIRAAFEQAGEAPPLLLEVTAGQGTCLGHRLEEIGQLLDALDGLPKGVCWDTAHLWAAGWDLTDEEVWEELWGQFRAVTGRQAPELVHLNDTNVELGRRVDRHARIGHGRLGVDTFRRVVLDPRLREVPMVLETPKGPDEVTWDREALELLRSLA